MKLLNTEEYNKAEKEIMALCKLMRDSAKIWEYQPNVVWSEKVEED